MILHHITEKRNIESIREKGLIPNIGKRSESVYDNREGIFLCESKYLPIWATLLGIKDPYVITIVISDNENDDDWDSFAYGSSWVNTTVKYEEIISKKPISPEHIESITPLSERCDEFVLEQTNESLIYNITMDLSTACYIAYRKYICRQEINNVAEAFDCLIASMKNLHKPENECFGESLNYWVDEYLKELEPYTFNDTVEYQYQREGIASFDGDSVVDGYRIYNNINGERYLKIWEMLDKFDDPETFSQRKLIVDKCRELGFDKITANTGGYYVSFDDIGLSNDTISKLHK